MTTDLLHGLGVVSLLFFLIGTVVVVGGLRWWYGRCSAAHARALRSDDDIGLRTRWTRWRWDTRVQYSKLPV